uniref:Uncharacterized protein n=1 Tax=Ixodes ricinus TaxID=34613 RepID=A0A090X8D9_IXORI
MPSGLSCLLFSSVYTTGTNVHMQTPGPRHLNLSLNLRTARSLLRCCHEVEASEEHSGRCGHVRRAECPPGTVSDASGHFSGNDAPHLQSGRDYRKACCRSRLWWRHLEHRSVGFECRARGGLRHRCSRPGSLFQELRGDGDHNRRPGAVTTCTLPSDTRWRGILRTLSSLNPPFWSQGRKVWTIAFLKVALSMSSGSVVTACTRLLRESTSRGKAEELGG